MFKGSYTALITPFKEGRVDDDIFESLIERQIENGTHGLVPCGTTGESPTLDYEEHDHVIELCIQIVGGRIPVIAGTGSNSTAEAIMMTEHAEKAGADAALIMTPYYNKPTQNGLYEHFRAIHDNTNIPIILYNVPSRSVVDINDKTTLKLAELPRIVGIKDATGDLSRPSNLIKSGIKDTFVQFTGEDSNAVEFNSLGGHGCISVTSNIAPKLCSDMQNASMNGDVDTANDIMKKLLPLHNILFCETSPQPVKYAAGLMGLCSNEMHLPLVLPSKQNQQKIKDVLKAQGNLI